ncbi:MAG: PEGA domain-containing protein [Ignavibacteria bacterium]|nr:PEGA domain-containing protein [Ignavibacteria bacterium]
MKKYFNYRFIFGLFLLLVLVGCATIIQPGPDRIPVSSIPIQGAKVYLDGKLVATTPTVVDVPRKSECVIRVELEGYEPVEIDRDKSLNGWFIGNLLIGGVIGITVDLIAHNQGGYSEEAVVVELKAKTASGESMTKYVQMKPIIEAH